MFSHLRGKEFVDLMEGIELSPGRSAHLDSCARCMATWQSMQTVHADVTSLDESIPEPDWAEFRASVRDQLLSRSVQRTSAVRRWTGWPIRPAMVWALSLCAMVGITAGVLRWNARSVAAPPTVMIEGSAPVPALELDDADKELAAWSNIALFDEVNQLEDAEQAQLRLMLEAAERCWEAMSKIAAVVLTVVISSSIGFAQQRQPARRPNAVAPAIEDVVEGFYVSQFPAQVDVGDDLFAKILPLLRQGLRERREISARKTRALNQLQMLVRRGGSEDDIRRMIREIDKADADAQTSQEKFLASIDPLLDARQQARLRVFQVMIEQRIRRMIDRARAPAPDR